MTEREYIVIVLRDGGEEQIKVNAARVSDAIRLVSAQENVPLTAIRKCYTFKKDLDLASRIFR